MKDADAEFRELPRGILTRGSSGMKEAKQVDARLEFILDEIAFAYDFDPVAAGNRNEFELNAVEGVRAIAEQLRAQILKYQVAGFEGVDPDIFDVALEEIQRVESLFFADPRHREGEAGFAFFEGQGR